jgi:AcrR family transcriptional regulator
MPSQKSTAVEPKRARGRARVEAILVAASQVFAEQGYDRATMTEIAARSSTAIGSLYRFFPTKETLGEALLQRFFERFAAAFDEVADHAAELAPSALADALIHAFRGSTSYDLRAGIAAVLEGRGDVDQLRRDFRARRRKQVARILRIANTSIDPADAQARAAVIVYLLKGEDTLAQEEPTASRRVIAELRRLVTYYVAEALRAPAS